MGKTRAEEKADGQKDGKAGQRQRELWVVAAVVVVG
jgi:hypothetical protein